MWLQYYFEMYVYFFSSLYFSLPLPLKGSQLCGVPQGREEARQENKYPASLSGFCVPKMLSPSEGGSGCMQGQRQII